jgi:hypothetical protein
MKLVQCPGCARHIRRDETACPFCHRAVAFEACDGNCQTSLAPSRAAVLFIGATALAACGKENGGGSEVVAVYGPPPMTSQIKQAVDAGTILMIEPPSVQDAGTEAGSPKPASSAKK